MLSNLEIGTAVQAVYTTEISVVIFYYLMLFMVSSITTRLLEIDIAEEFKMRYPDTEFLFVGAKDRMEMEKIPKAGYKIIGLWISGCTNNSEHLANGLMNSFKTKFTI